jgi:hypothetical protein
VAEVRQVIKDTLTMEDRDPANYNIAGIFRDAFYFRGPAYGYGAEDEAAWRAAVAKHERKTAARR